MGNLAGASAFIQFSPIKLFCFKFSFVFSHSESSELKRTGKLARLSRTRRKIEKLCVPLFNTREVRSYCCAECAKKQFHRFLFLFLRRKQSEFSKWIAGRSADRYRHRPHKSGRWRTHTWCVQRFNSLVIDHDIYTIFTRIWAAAGTHGRLSIRPDHFLVNNFITFQARVKKTRFYLLVALYWFIGKHLYGTISSVAKS